MPYFTRYSILAQSARFAKRFSPPSSIFLRGGRKRRKRRGGEPPLPAPPQGGAGSLRSPPRRKALRPPFPVFGQKERQKEQKLINGHRDEKYSLHIARPVIQDDRRPRRRYGERKEEKDTAQGDALSLSSARQKRQQRRGIRREPHGEDRADRTPRATRRRSGRPRKHTARPRQDRAPRTPSDKNCTAHLPPTARRTRRQARDVSPLSRTRTARPPAPPAASAPRTASACPFPACRQA